MAHAPGTLFEHYEIRSLLGKGGMGEVYLAYDSQHRRQVALKLLPAEFANDAERLRRFTQEAFATTSLKSNYFISIYEVGQSRSFPFLAMEFVEGVTLRQHLKVSRMTVVEALGVAHHLAEALRVAHECGIVHRDIKPENIMLCGDNGIKVLDLGLAKLTEAFHYRMSTPEAQTVTNINTSHGAIIGTVNYMSPEQLRGLIVDERTDIWSLGVVLYEMLLGESPFNGRSTGEMIVSILEKEPPSLTQCWPERPALLEQVLHKLLQKERDKRYQTTHEVLRDLSELGRSMGRDVERHTIVMLASPPAREGETDDLLIRETASAAGDTAPNAEFSSTNEKTLAWEGVASLSRANRFGRDLLRSDRKHHQVKALLLALLLFVAAYTINDGYQAFVSSRRSGTTQTMKFSALNLPGDAKEAALSPDGKYVVAILEDVGKQSLMVKEFATDVVRRIVAPGDEQYMGLTISPDGGYVYYLRKEQETGTLFRVPRLGGLPQKILDNVNTPVTFSPDGKRFAFVRYDMKAQSTILMAAHADGADAREIATRYPPMSFTLGGSRASGPAWSPDGRVIACPTFNTSGLLSDDILAVNLEDNTQRRINANSWASIERIAWLDDGSGLVMNAADTTDAPRQIWLLSFAHGEARRITNDANSYESVSAQRGFNSMVAVRSDQISSIWLLSGEDMRSARQITGSKKGFNGISWAPNKQLVYTSGENDGQNIWIMGKDGNNPTQLTFGVGVNVQPAVSADGRYIIFVSFRDGMPHIWRMDADGANHKQLTNGVYEDTPQISSDGRWVVYHSIHPGRDSIWRVPIDGGTPELLSKVLSLHPVISPGGKMIASFSRDQEPTAPWRIALMPFAGGEPVKWFNLPAPIDVTWPTLRWAPDGRSITYIASVNGVSNVWRQGLEGRSPFKLTDFKENQILSFAWSTDGTELACVRGLQTNDAVMISGFK